MTTIGYIRVSSNKQTLEHQRFEIENFARREGIKIDEWIEEKISSRKALDKRKLGELLNNLQEDDILITCEISRLGRSLLEVMKILETCLNKNCQVWTIKENYRLGNDIQSKVLAFAFGLAIIAMAYGVGNISGGHVNPAVSIGVLKWWYVNKGFLWICHFPDTRCTCRIRSSLSDI